MMQVLWTVPAGGRLVVYKPGLEDGVFEQNLLLILALLPFGGAIMAATLPANARNAEAWLAGMIMVTGLFILGALHGQVQAGGRVVAQIDWIPALGLNLRFRLDGFSWLFMLLVLGIGLLVVLYARYYMSPKDPVPRFYAFLLAFSGAMSGVLLSGNIIMLVVYWELTSVFSFLLIGYWYHLPSAREGARMALTVTGLGGLCLLGAMLLIGHMVGSYDLDRVLGAGSTIREHALYLPALALFLLGAFTKSAQFPFHFWLPNAMAAPTPVSAYLHSATMVKAGVFLLVRFSPALGGTDAWFLAVVGTGMTTLVLGALVALFRHDLKGLLAYSTISHLGLITALAGMGSPLAIVAAIFHIVNHAVFKASLFMAAGIIDHETGTRDMRRLGGLMRMMPLTGVLAIIAASAMAGVPLLNGFLSKEMFFAEAAEWHNGTVLDEALPWLATIAGAFSVAYSLRFVVSVFFGPSAADLLKVPHEPPAWMRRPVEILVLVCLAVGILPALTLGPWLGSAVESVLGPDLPYYSLSIWHGVNTALLMSIAALVIGSLLFFLAAAAIRNGPEGPPLMHRLRAHKVYEWIMLRLSRKGPRILYELVGTEKLQPQLRALVLLAVIGSAMALWGSLQDLTIIPTQGIDPVFTLLWLVGGAAAIGAAQQAKYHRFAAIILMSIAGLVSCITFAWLSAPDLAVTQLLVEIVTTVLLLLGLRWLPRRRDEILEDKLMPARLRRARDFVIALCSGLGIAAVAFVIMKTPQGTNVGDWFLRNAYSEGGGTNVVNVILVDFRAFDTFGEITVLAIVGLAVFALLRRFRPAVESTGIPEQRAGQGDRSLDDYLFVPSVIMQWMFAPIIALSAYLFFRGHDLPGGGFAAGITLAIGLLLQYLAANVRWVEMRMTILPTRWMGIGLLIAAGTGTGSWLFGYPFLSMHAQYMDIPIIGEVPAATALLFDAVVFGVVVGATVLMLIAIAHQSLRSSRLRSQDEAEPERRAG